LVRYPKLRYELGGHADGSGNPEVNRILSQARAVAVKSYLAEKEPELEERIGVAGYGDSQPVADNGSGRGRWANRKPDLKVANKAALAEYVQPPEADAPANTAMGPEQE
jgi:outer membrane protein OmpA-like peptidoglycan-associated protein